eukprot:11544313-Heterocapsa_arctica.AAC.1
MTRPGKPTSKPGGPCTTCSRQKQGRPGSNTKRNPKPTTRMNPGRYIKNCWTSKRNDKGRKDSSSPSRTKSQDKRRATGRS